MARTYNVRVGTPFVPLASVGVNDAMGVTDSVARDFTVGRSQTNPVGITDSITPVLAGAVTINQSNPVGITDSTSLVLTGSSDLTAVGGDHQITLSWSTFSGASSVKVYRKNTLHHTQATELIATLSGSATSYTDLRISNHTLALADDYTGGNLPLGALINYVVRPVIGGVEQAGIQNGTRPDDGYVHPNWTSLNGSLKRDSRNVGLLMHNPDLSSFTVEPTQVSLGPGTYTGIIFEQTVIIAAPGTWNFVGCWLKKGLFNGNTPTQPTKITAYRCRIGPGYGMGGGYNSTEYDLNNLFGGCYGNWEVIQCEVMHGGNQLMGHSGTSLCEDSYFHDLCSYVGAVNPHMDSIWVQSATSSVTIRRSHFEAAASGMSSVIGPGYTTGMLLEDNLFNSGSANGCIYIGPGGTYRRNRFKRYPTGGYVTFEDVDPASQNHIYSSGGTPAVFTDNRWVDDGSSI